jgi:ankyrin repeat protein
MFSQRIRLASLTLGIAAILCGQPADPEQMRSSIGRAVARLQSTEPNWWSHQACTSCHHQAMPAKVYELASMRGIHVDLAALQEFLDKGFSYLADADRAIQGSHQIDPAIADGYNLVAAYSLGVPDSISTGAYAKLIARRQMPDGRGVSNDSRPPQTGSEFTATALAVRGISRYLPKSMAAEKDERTARAHAWLRSAKPRDTEDRMMQILGLEWCGAGAAEIAPFAKDLLRQQRDDGGWSQIPAMASDAYATGEALFVLGRNLSGVWNDKGVWRGFRWLLDHQQPDGLWRVATRIHEPAPLSPPYFDSGIPYGHDQFISVMGTSWAAMAMEFQLKGSRDQYPTLNYAKVVPAGTAPWMETVLFGSADDLRELLDSGWDPNSSTSKGTSALMMAAADPEKVKLLLDHGAEATAEAKTRFTALMMAASHGSAESVRLLIEKGARVNPVKGQPAFANGTPILFGVWSGNLDVVRQLLAKGAEPRQKFLLAGVFPMTTLELAAIQDDREMVRLLVNSGVPVDEQSDDEGMTALGWSVFKNAVKEARVLLSLGARVDHRDRLGWTPLLWAANVDYGDSKMVELLLGAGADPRARNKEGLTALDLAKKWGHRRHQMALKRALASSSRRATDSP